MTAPKKLTASVSDKMLAGVCGGLAEYMNADPTVVRLLVALATLVTGIFPGVLLYLIAAIIMPKEGDIRA